MLYTELYIYYLFLVILLIYYHKIMKRTYSFSEYGFDFSSMKIWWELELWRHLTLKMKEYWSLLCRDTYTHTRARFWEYKSYIYIFSGVIDFGICCQRFPNSQSYIFDETSLFCASKEKQGFEFIRSNLLLPNLI